MTSLRVATWNLNGLTPNKNELETIMIDHKLDIVLISEAHCTASTCVKFQYYDFYSTNHPDGTAHAGSALLIRKNIKHHQLPDYKTEYIQATSVCISDGSSPINFSAVYCPPKHKITDDMFWDYLRQLGNRFVAGGDWNSKHIHWGSRLTTTRGRQLKLCMDKNHLTALTTAEPTYWPSDPKKIPDLLDFFITKGMSSYYSKVESCLDGSSDHTPVLLTISNLLIESEETERLYNKYTDWELFRQHVNANIKIKVALKSAEDIENATIHITQLIQEACWLSTPLSQKSVHRDNIPLDIHREILDKRKLRRIWQESRLRADKTKLNKASADLKNQLQEWYDQTLSAKLLTLTPTQATNYSLWKFAKSYNRPQIMKPPLRIEEKWLRTAKDKASAFAAHLAKVFTANDTDGQTNYKDVDDILGQDLQLSPPPKPVTVHEVWHTIRHLKNKKAPGFDLISKEVLINLPKKATTFLTMLYNGILRVQYFPQLWKVSIIQMIHKHGKPVHEVSSYRPISLLPTMSKVFEKLLKRRLVPILENNQTIPDHQFGFRQQHSTVEQVHRVYDHIRKAFEEKKYCSAAFLDIQQAFDKVWHRGLLCKVKTMLPHSYYLLIESYLGDRIFQVKESNSTSTFYDINAGVPQGSVLGPLLYTIYTADLPVIDNATTATFADDTAILASNTNPKCASATLQEGLDKVTEWLKKWRIKASATKSVQITFTLRKENCPPVNLENTTLPHQDKVKYLGLHLDRRLTWKDHIKSKREELNIRYKGLFWLMGRNSKLSMDNKLLIYKSILKPIWTYGMQLWGTASTSNITKIQRMQNIILRTISGVPWYITNSEIHTQLSMNTVKEEIENASKTYSDRLKNHPNKLAVQLTTPNYTQRLKRKNVIYH